MAVKRVNDHGQQLATPEGHAIGFVDTKEQFDAVTKALGVTILAGWDSLC